MNFHVDFRINKLKGKNECFKHLNTKQSFFWIIQCAVSSEHTPIKLLTEKCVSKWSCQNCETKYRNWRDDFYKQRIKLNN